MKQNINDFNTMYEYIRTLADSDNNPELAPYIVIQEQLLAKYLEGHGQNIIENKDLDLMMGIMLIQKLIIAYKAVPNNLKAVPNDLMADNEDRSFEAKAVPNDLMIDNEDRSFEAKAVPNDLMIDNQDPFVYPKDKKIFSSTQELFKKSQPIIGAFEEEVVKENCCSCNIF